MYFCQENIHYLRFIFYVSIYVLYAYLYILKEIFWQNLVGKLLLEKCKIKLMAFFLLLNVFKRVIRSAFNLLEPLSLKFFFQGGTVNNITNIYNNSTIIILRLTKKKPTYLKFYWLLIITNYHMGNLVRLNVYLNLFYLILNISYNLTRKCLFRKKMVLESVE